ncbi:MAG: beta-ketoacyl-ACP synthase II [Phycisphaerae bacterium]
MTKRRVVITGLGIVTPLGDILDTFWGRLLDGKCGIRTLTRFDVSAYPVRIGGEITPEDFHYEDIIGHKEAKRLDRFALYGMAAGIRSVLDSGIDFSTLDRDRCGVIVGSGIGGIEEMEQQYDKMLAKGVGRVSPFTVPRLMVNAAAGNLSIQFGLSGPVSATATACATSGNAIADAFHSITFGEADVMLAGGAEAAMTKLGMAAFCALRALSTRNDAPEKASRPFSKDRDGFVMSEGAGVVVLEEYELAKKRGARIYGEILACGATGDACHITAPDENGTGAAKAMNKALAEAGINPDQVQYINAHGTSTELGDLAETRAVHKTFGPAAKKVPVSSTKGALGHSLGASGGIELAIACLAMHRGVLPPTINYDEPDPLCDLDYVPNRAREAKVQYAMSNSFGFGGHNTSILIGKV